MTINGKRLNERLAQLEKIGQTKDGGVTRLSLTSEYKEAESLVSRWMQEAGFSVRIDEVGNLIGRRDGTSPGAPAIMIGSHIDTVINGGRFDGTIGVLAGIEVAQTLRENNIILNHALEVVVFIEEESTRWEVSTLGSHTMVGQIEPDKILQRRDSSGKTMAESMQEVGLNPDHIQKAQRNRNEIACFLELHIEQGAVLENMEYPVGVVTGIAAQVIMELHLTGRTDHAGSTPMNMRRDALAGAAQIILDVQRIAKETGPTCVATVGKLDVENGALNAVPGKVFMTLDIRDIHEKTREKMIQQIGKAVHAAALENNLKCELNETSRLIPALLPDNMVETITEACKKIKVPIHKMPSGASHDAQVMTELTDVGMIFVRSKDGISHSPEEYSDPDDIALGADVLYETVILLDSNR